MDKLEEIKDDKKHGYFNVNEQAGKRITWLISEIERKNKALEFYAIGKHLNLSENIYETGAIALRALKEE